MLPPPLPFRLPAPPTPATSALSTTLAEEEADGDPDRARGRRGGRDRHLQRPSAPARGGELRAAADEPRPDRGRGAERAPLLQRGGARPEYAHRAVSLQPDRRLVRLHAARVLRAQQ